MKLGPWLSQGFEGVRVYGNQSIPDTLQIASESRPNHCGYECHAVYCSSGCIGVMPRARVDTRVV